MIKDIMVTDSLPFPPLKGVVNVPLFTPEGQLLTVPGYQAGLGYYLDLAPELQAIIFDTAPS